VIHALSVLKGTAYEDRLLELLNNTSPRERCAAAHALHHSGTERAIAPLIGVLNDESAEVRGATMFAIRQLCREASDEQARAAAIILIDFMANDHEVGHNDIHNTLVRMASHVRLHDRPPNGPFGEDLKAARLKCAQAWRQWWDVSGER
jgi:HEAT repeat protein